MVLGAERSAAAAAALKSVLSQLVLLTLQSGSLCLVGKKRKSLYLPAKAVAK